MTLLYFILILGIIIFIHELGHFIFAKKAGIYCYEFSLGMGPKIWSRKSKKSETTYCLRAIPIGGFVSMAGESIDEDKEIPKKMRMQSKTWLQRFLTIIAGPLFNFILAFIILLVIGFCFGSTEQKTYVGNAIKNYPASEQGLQKGDRILEIDGNKVLFWDQALLKLQLISDDKPIDFKIERDGLIKTISIAPKKELIEGSDDAYRYLFGIQAPQTKKYGFTRGISYASTKIYTMTDSMFTVIGGLFTGGVALNNLSGPVGIYNVVGVTSKAGFENILYLIAYLSVNVGFINLIPIPAFDGGRILFLVIEKIKGKPVSPKVENTIHSVCFFLLIALMVIITFNDILRLF